MQKAATERSHGTIIAGSRPSATASSPKNVERVVGPLSRLNCSLTTFCAPTNKISMPAWHGPEDQPLGAGSCNWRRDDITT